MPQVRDRSAEHAAARTLEFLPTFVGKLFVPLEAELKNPKRLDETERRLDAWLKRRHFRAHFTRILDAFKRRRGAGRGQQPRELERCSRRYGCYQFAHLCHQV